MIRAIFGFAFALGMLWVLVMLLPIILSIGLVVISVGAVGVVLFFIAALIKVTFFKRKE